MTYEELRQFIKEANALGLSPIEKDVFQYYYSRTQNEEGEWYCSDTETAEDINRSRNGVCTARKSLIARKWITEREHFNISVVKTFTTPVRNQTETPEPEAETQVPIQTDTHDSQSETGLASPKSDSPVSNQTETGESSVRNQTPLIPYKGNLGTEVKEEDKREESLSPREREKRRGLSVDEAADYLDAEPELPDEDLSPTKAIKIWREVYPRGELVGERLKEFAEIFPDTELNSPEKETAWRINLKEWKVSKWNSDNISGQIKRFREIEAKNNGAKSNGQPKQNSNGNLTERGPAQNGVGKRTNFEISRDRDYSDFENFDPIATFKT